MIGRCREERGSALIAAIVLIGVMMSIGLATASYVDGQQTQSGGERTRESAFNLAEAALGAQVLQASRADWPSTAATAWPASCAPSSTSATSCPDAASLAESYKTPDYSSAPCPGGASSAPAWKTIVHDDSAGAERYYSATTSAGAAQPTWDSNGNGRMWVKSTGTARCKQRTIIAAIEQGERLLSFPHNALTANWVHILNNGRKVLINTKGDAAQTSYVVLRCTPPLGWSPCPPADSGQIGPGPAKQADPGSSPVATPVGDLAQFKAKAVKLNTYYAAGTCPPSLAGTAVYVEDFTGCSTSGNANSANAPGHLYIGTGTLSLGGNTRFYGLVYMGNQQRSSGAVVSLSGNARITGAVAVDGLGGVNVGSSKENITFDPKAFDEFKGIANLAMVPNTWRELKPGS